MFALVLMLVFFDNSSFFGCTFGETEGGHVHPSFFQY